MPAPASSPPSITELLRVLQFGDSVLPVGAFSFSGALESAVQQGIVHDADTLEQFVRTAVHQAATADGIALVQAHRAAVAADLSRIIAIDHAVLNRKLNEEIRTMTTRMGRKLAELCEHVRPQATMAGFLAAIRARSTPGTYPVAQAVAFVGFGLGEHDAFAAHQYGVASMITGAALRLMRVTYLDAQAILLTVTETADDDYAAATSADLADMATFAPLTEIAAGIHIRATVRMFMT
jgi:urease accessory protein